MEMIRLIELERRGFNKNEDEPVDETLNDGHLSLLELLLGVSASGVGDVDGMAGLDVIGQGDILDFDAKFVERASTKPEQNIRSIAV